MAKSTVAAVRIDGLADFRKRLKAAGDDDLSKEFKDANHKIAENVVQMARYKATLLGPMQHDAAQQLRAARSGVQAEVRFTNKRGFEHGAEFGAGRNRQRSTRRGMVTGWNQFKPWRGNKADAGYFLFPAIRDLDSKTINEYNERLREIVAYMFPN